VCVCVCVCVCGVCVMCVCVCVCARACVRVDNSCVLTSKEENISVSDGNLTVAQLFHKCLHFFSSPNSRKLNGINPVNCPSVLST